MCLVINAIGFLLVSGDYSPALWRRFVPYVTKCPYVTKLSFCSSTVLSTLKVGRLASEPVTVELLKSKSFPSLYTA